jgi:hypothetical protein
MLRAFAYAGKSLPYGFPTSQQSALISQVATPRTKAARRRPGKHQPIIASGFGSNDSSIGLMTIR